MRSSKFGRKTMQYLYDDGENCQFMDTESYEQVAISDEDVGEAKNGCLMV